MTARALGLLNLMKLLLLNLEVICLTNLEIICNEAILNGIYTRAEIEDMLAQGLEPALHTYTGWKARGKVVKHGEKGIETRLWKKRKSKAVDDENNESVEVNGNFYLAKAFLFSEAQVDDLVDCKSA